MDYTDDELRSIAAGQPPAQDPEAGARAVAAQAATPAKDAQDRQQEAAFLKYQASNTNVPANTMAEAQRYAVAKPGYDLDYIVNNLDKVRAEIQADKTPWEQIAAEHPVLAKYIGDPSTASQALQDTSMLTGMNRWTGGVVSQIGPEVTDSTGKTYHQRNDTPVAPFWAKEAYDHLTNDVPSMGANLAMLYTDSAKWLTERLGFEVPEGLKARQKYWQDTAMRLSKGTTAGKDYLGPNAPGKWYEPAQIARGLEVGVGFVAKNAALIAAAAMSGGSAKGLMAINTAYAASDLYPKTKEITGGDTGKALAVTAVGAPVLGKIMGWNPVSNSAGQALSDAVENGVGRAAADALKSQSYRSLAWLTAKKLGLDFFVGKTAFAAQGAAGAAVEETAKAWAGKDTDITNVGAGWTQGWHDGDAAALMSAYGTAHQIVEHTGRALRAREMGNTVGQIMDAMASSKLATQSPELHDQIVGEIARQPGHDPYLHIPLDKFNETLEKAGYDPREVAAHVHGDEGAAYDKALQEHAEHLKFPIEKARVLAQSKVLDELVRNEGSLRADVGSKSVADQMSEEFTTALQEAIKVDPEKLTEEDKGLYAAVKGVAGTDEEAGKKMYATVKALATQHPNLTLQQVFDSTFGEGGVFGPPAKINMSVEDGGLAFTHPAAPLKLELDHGLINGEPTYEAMNLGFTDQSRSEKSLVDEFKGKGYSSALYLAALETAQRAGHGFASSAFRSAASERMYERLKEAGLPFGMTNGRFHLSAEALKNVDLKSVREALAPEGAPTSLPRQADAALVQHAGIFDATGWEKVFPDDEQRAKFTAQVEEARSVAQERLAAAIKAGVREYLPQQRQQLEDAAREQIKSDPVYRAQHFFQTGELWHGEDFHKAILTDPTTGKPLRLLDSEIDSVMGPGAAALLKEAKRGVVTSDPAKSIGIDEAAAALGFGTDEGARKLVNGLKNALSEGQYVKQLADLRLQEINRNALLDDPQKLTQAVMDAAQNEKVVPVLLSRMRAMAEQLGSVQKARSNMSPEAWESLARRLVSDKTLGELKPETYVRAGLKASERGLQALEEGKVDKAFNATEAQLLNHYMYRVAREQAGSVGAMYTALAERATSEKWRATLGKADPAYRDLHDALLGAVGIGDAVEEPGSKLDAFTQKIVENAQDVNLAAGTYSGWDPEVVRSFLDGGKSWEELKPAEAAEVFKAIKNIQHIAKTQNAALKAIQNAHVDELVRDAQVTMSGGALGSGQAGPLVPGELPYQDRTQAPKKGLVQRALENTALRFQWNGANLDAPRVMLGMLGAKVKEHVWGGFIERRNYHEQLLRDLFLPWKETQAVFEKDVDLDKPLPGIESPFLVEGAGGKHVELPGLRLEGQQGQLSKRYLLQMTKWIGSESGREKALKSLGVPLESVTTAIGRYLEPHHLDAVQAEHKFFDEKLFPLKDAEHQARTGLPLEKVKAMPYTIKFANGTERTYEGGYYPVHWDRRPGIEVARPPVEMDRNSGLFNPKVPDGSFNARTGYVGSPDFNWDNIPAHLLADTHNLAFGSFVQDANRVLLDKRLQAAMAQYLPEGYSAYPRQWLESVAGGATGSVPEHLRNVNAALRLGRSALVTGAIGFNLPLVAAHMLHPMAVGTMRDGAWFAATYGAKSMSRVLEGAAGSLVSGTNPVREEALAKSAELVHRSETLRDSMQRWYGSYLAGNEPGFAKTVDHVMDAVHNTAFWHLREMDNLVSTMVWDAKYRHGIDTHGDELRAVKEADEQVQASMPNYSAMETPPVMAKQGSISSAFLIFHSFWAKYYEMAHEQKQKMIDVPFREASYGNGSTAPAAVSASQWAGRTAAMLAFSAIMGEFMMGHGKKADEDWQTWLMRSTLAAPTKLFPYAYDLAKPLIDYSFGQGRHMEKPDFPNPYFEQTARVIKAVGDLQDNRKTSEDKVFGSINAALGFAGAPATQLGRTGRYVYRTAVGEEEPSGPLDVAAGAIYGKKYGRAARFSEANPLEQLQHIFDRE